jgi:hypothetical protein
MALKDAELYVQAYDLAGDRQALFEDALSQVPGVEFVSPRTQPGPSVEACVQVAFDPEVTNPVAIKEALARLGFNVLSARESDTAQTE